MSRIQLRRKLTTGAPLVGDLLVGELCLNIPDSTFYWKKDTSTIVGPIGVNVVTGDMLKSVYDTNNNGRPDVADNALQLGGIAASSYATIASVTSQIAALVGSAPATLDTLQEIAAQLALDENGVATLTALVGTKLDANSTIDGGSF